METAIKMHRYTPIFFVSFTKGKTFVTSCLLLWMKKLLQSEIYSLRKEFAPRGANSFLQKLTSIEKKGKNQNGRAASPESKAYKM